MKTACVFSLAAGLLLVATTDAVPVSFDLKGKIAQETAGSVSDPIDSSYGVGDSFKLFLSYDTLNHPDRDPASDTGLYGDQVSFPFLDFIEWSTSLNEVPFARSIVTTTTLRVKNGSTDELELRGELAQGGFVTLLLQDLTGKALHSDALPTSLDLAKWDIGDFTQQQAWGTVVEGRLTGLRAVPDTGSALSLFGISLAALGFARKLNTKRSRSTD
jgi:hypothetical protein